MKYLVLVCVLLFINVGHSADPVTLCECSVNPQNHNNSSVSVITFLSNDNSCIVEKTHGYFPNVGVYNVTNYQLSRCKKSLLVDKNYFDQKISKLKNQNEKDRRLILNLTKLLQKQIDEITGSESEKL